jgi:hypothetical protein
MFIPPGPGPTAPNLPLGTKSRSLTALQKLCTSGFFTTTSYTETFTHKGIHVYEIQNLKTEGIFDQNKSVASSLLRPNTARSPQTPIKAMVVLLAFGAISGTRGYAGTLSLPICIWCRLRPLNDSDLLLPPKPFKYSINFQYKFYDIYLIFYWQKLVVKPYLKLRACLINKTRGHYFQHFILLSLPKMCQVVLDCNNWNLIQIYHIR